MVKATKIKPDLSAVNLYKFVTAFSFRRATRNPFLLGTFPAKYAVVDTELQL